MVCKVPSFLSPSQTADITTGWPRGSVPTKFECSGGGGGKIGNFMKQKKPKLTLLADEGWGSGGVSKKKEISMKNIGVKGKLENFVKKKRGGGVKPYP